LTVKNEVGGGTELSQNYSLIKLPIKNEKKKNEKSKKANKTQLIVATDFRPSKLMELLFLFWTLKHLFFEKKSEHTLFVVNLKEIV